MRLLNPAGFEASSAGYVGRRRRPLGDIDFSIPAEPAEEPKAAVVHLSFVRTRINSCAVIEFYGPTGDLMIEMVRSVQ